MYICLQPLRLFLFMVFMVWHEKVLKGRSALSLQSFPQAYAGSNTKYLGSGLPRTCLLLWSYYAFRCSLVGTMYTCLLLIFKIAFVTILLMCPSVSFLPRGLGMIFRRPDGVHALLLKCYALYRAPFLLSINSPYVTR